MHRVPHLCTEYPTLRTECPTYAQSALPYAQSALPYAQSATLYAQSAPLYAQSATLYAQSAPPTHRVPYPMHRDDLPTMERVYLSTLPCAAHLPHSHTIPPSTHLTPPTTLLYPSHILPSLPTTLYHLYPSHTPPLPSTHLTPSHTSPPLPHSPPPLSPHTLPLPPHSSTPTTIHLHPSHTPPSLPPPPHPTSTPSSTQQCQLPHNTALAVLPVMLPFFSSEPSAQSGKWLASQQKWMSTHLAWSAHINWLAGSHSTLTADRYTITQNMKVACYDTQSQWYMRTYHICHLTVPFPALSHIPSPLLHTSPSHHTPPPLPPRLQDSCPTPFGQQSLQLQQIPSSPECTFCV